MTAPWRHHPRLQLAAMAGLALALLLPAIMPLSPRIILGLDLGGVIFLLLAWLMMVAATPASMRYRARLQDEEQPVVLLLTVGAALFGLAAIGVEKFLPAQGEAN